MSQESLLLAIPSEIRLLIFHFLFNLDLWNIPRFSGCYEHPAGACDLNLHNDTIYTKTKWNPGCWKNFTAILRTCRLINREAIDVLYEQTIFRIRISDERYNRKMRAFAPVNECAFLPRIQQVLLDPDVRQHDALLALPTTLTKVLLRLTSEPQKTAVHFGITSGSLTGYPPQFSPIEAVAEEAEWELFLRRMAILAKRCKFLITTPSVRNNVKKRLDQVVEAVEGSPKQTMSTTESQLIRGGVQNLTGSVGYDKRLFL